MRMDFNGVKIEGGFPVRYVGNTRSNILKQGTIYWVTEVIQHSFSTEFKLEDIDEKFNSVDFEDVHLRSYYVYNYQGYYPLKGDRLQNFERVDIVTKKTESVARSGIIKHARLISTNCGEYITSQSRYLVSFR